MEVGIRELKAKLSAYVDRAAAGETVVVTDRGTPVAQLAPLPGRTELARGVDEGWIEPSRRPLGSAPPRPAAARSVMDALDEDRG
jgi:prevent-host-death family protein